MCKTNSLFQVFVLVYSSNYVITLKSYPVCLYKTKYLFMYPLAALGRTPLPDNSRITLFGCDSFPSSQPNEDVPIKYIDQKIYRLLQKHATGMGGRCYLQPPFPTLTKQKDPFSILLSGPLIPFTLHHLPLMLHSPP